MLPRLVSTAVRQPAGAVQSSRELPSAGSQEARAAAEVSASLKEITNMEESFHSEVRKQFVTMTKETFRDIIAAKLGIFLGCDVDMGAFRKSMTKHKS